MEAKNTHQKKSIEISLGHNEDRGIAKSDTRRKYFTKKRDRGKQRLTCLASMSKCSVEQNFGEIAGKTEFTKGYNG